MATTGSQMADQARQDERPAKRPRKEPISRLTEQDAGMLQYVHPGWAPVQGVIKQRYADFLVHEIAPSGEVMHITALGPPPAWKPSGETTQTHTWSDLGSFFDDGSAPLEAMARGTSDAPPHVDTRVLHDKAERTRVHQLVREIAGHVLESEAETTEAGPAVRVKRRTSTKPRRSDPASEASAAPPYIHFLLQKTNRDSQEALQWLARFVRLDGGRGHRASASNALSVAGTKDKRAITVQRVALQRGQRTLADVWCMVNHIGQPVSNAPHAPRRTEEHAVTTRAERGLRIAHLCYAHQPLQLGDLSGNQFTITLRDVRWATGGDAPATSLSDELRSRVEIIARDGFINYFGMQRFGTGAVPTHAVGIAILRGDYGAALKLILDGPQGDTDDEGAPPAVVATRAARAACAAGKYDEAYHQFPKTCVAERAVLEKMRAPHWQPNDVLGAFQNIPRTLRLMYVHAYQSYLWNRMVSERVRRFGALRPVPGDRVDVRRRAGDVSSAASEDTFDHIQTLSEADAAQRSMDEIVMPMPGSQVSVDGWLADMYREMLAADGLTPASLTSSRQPEYRLRGSYRALVQRPRDMSCKVRAYRDADLALVASDEEQLIGLTPPAEADSEGKPLLALTLVFSLPPSSYATILLRELLRTDTSAHVHKALTKEAKEAAAEA